jgi:hypothetical protein
VRPRPGDDRGQAADALDDAACPVLVVAPTDAEA